MDELYVEEFSFSGGKKKLLPSEEPIQELKMQLLLDEHTPFGYFELLEKALHKESKNSNFFIPFLSEIQAKLEEGDTKTILHLIDEIEEFLDIEFFKN